VAVVEGCQLKLFLTSLIEEEEEEQLQQMFLKKKIFAD
jgi:hypothetical protein